MKPSTSCAKPSDSSRPMPMPIERWVRLLRQGKLDEATDQFQQTDRLRTDSSLLLTGIKKLDEHSHWLPSGVRPSPLNLPEFAAAAILRLRLLHCPMSQVPSRRARQVFTIEVSHSLITKNMTRPWPT